MSRFQLLDAFQDVTFVVDREWKLHFGNTSACLLLEVTPRRLASGKSFSQFMSFSASVTNDQGLSGVDDLTPAREVMFTLPGSGKTGWVQVVVQPVPEYMKEDGKLDLYVVSMRDTTLERTLNEKYRGELDQKESVIRDLQEARKALEQYSHLLEQRVQERTSELREANRLQKTILDSLGQGILVFDKNGICLPVFSKVCLKMLNGEPSGRSITEVLGFKGDEAEGFGQWRNAVFDQLLDFEDMAPLAPDHLRSPLGLELHFDYYPMLGAAGDLLGIVVVATDQTREMEALRKAEVERNLVSKVTSTARNRDAFRLFLSEARKLLGGLKTPENLDLDDITRRLHTLKGGAGSFSILSLVEACHELESEVKVHAGKRLKVDALLREHVGPLMTDLDETVRELAELLGPSIADSDARSVEIPTEQLVRWSEQLTTAQAWTLVHQISDEIFGEATEKPVGSMILHHGVSLKGLAASMGKRLEKFEVLGAETKVAVEEYRGLLTSLVHALRNSVYHGLESAEERLRAGKPEGGKVFAKFSKSAPGAGPFLRIEIGDDGRGVDPEKIRAKLREKDLGSLAELNDAEVIQAILRDDFSTATEVGVIAGRGVGLSAIASEVRALGGWIRVNTELGRGMKLQMEIPIGSRTFNTEKRGAA